LYNKYTINTGKRDSLNRFTTHIKSEKRGLLIRLQPGTRPPALVLVLASLALLALTPPLPLT